MLDFSQAKKIEWQDSELLIPYLRNLATPSCEMSFANLKMWSEVYGTEFLQYGENYLFFSASDGILYFPRWSNLSAELLVEIANDFKNFYQLGQVTIYDVDPEWLEDNGDICNFFHAEANEDDFDYLYFNENLAAMSGAILKKKRNLINQFQKNYPNYFIEYLSAENADKCSKFARDLNNLLEQTEFVDEENQSMDYAFKNLELLDLQGFMLYAEPNLPVGFTVYSFLNDTYADIHYEKACHDVKGSPQILVQLLANELLKKGVKCMNREQDLGSNGIRQAKKSLAPFDYYRRVKLAEIK
ncbi:MAG: DUF2156 domain-containing protein [Lentisphaeria bacterium]|nr:DUF2156 domain-containing protein [Lentisphaeria bacterium]